MLRWGDIFHTFANFWTFAPLHLRKQSGRPQTPALFGFNSVGETDSFPLRVCVLWVQYCVFLCIILSQFHSLKMPPMYSQSTGFVVTSLKKLKSLSRQKQSVEAHKYSCGYATDGRLFMQPQHYSEGFSCFMKHCCFPRWEAPSSTLLVTLSICPSQELRGTLP